MDSNRGQIFGTDVITAAALFTITLSALLMFWDYGKTRLDENSRMAELEAKANTLSDVLVKTPGSPADWEGNPSDGNVTSVGLAVTDRVIAKEKLEAVDRIDEQRLRAIFMAGSDGIGIKLMSADGDILAEYGLRPAGPMVAKVTRVVTCDGRPALLEVAVWPKT